MTKILKQTGIISTKDGIKSLISLKTGASSGPTVFSLDNVNTITSPYEICNTFKPLLLLCIYSYEFMKKAGSIHMNIFQTIYQIKVVVQYFYNLLIRKK